MSKYETAIYVSLGHNSSAVLAKSGQVVQGYEQERIDRKKSSSAYPKDAIELCLPSGQRADVAYVSHWFDRFDLHTNRYLDLAHLKTKAARVVSLSAGFTHHDAHARSAASFCAAAGGDCAYADVFVIDGFGNLQECLSAYRTEWPFSYTSPVLTHRSYGYDMSLGLMYQYTTEYLGLRPNQDEYKLLGYESNIRQHVTREHAARAWQLVSDAAKEHAYQMLGATTPGRESRVELFDVEALRKARARWWAQADQWRSYFPAVVSDAGVRACVAFCAQTYIEQCVSTLITTLAPRRDRPLILSGGCFYNVKLSRRIQRATGRRVFVHPLAGDQGAALGHTPKLVAKDLTWGARILGQRRSLPPGCRYVTQSAWVDAAAQELINGGIVNVVRGAMEFGPRALSHTTTFARPTAKSVARINALNDRDDSMPMAPVISEREAIRLFPHDELRNTAPSTRYMITTVAFRQSPAFVHSPEFAAMRGVMHPDPLDQDVWTARPQIVDNDSEEDRLIRAANASCLINTSFNYHGEPIVFSEDDACRTHELQVARARALGNPSPVTLLVRNI